MARGAGHTAGWRRGEPTDAVPYVGRRGLPEDTSLDARQEGRVLPFVVTLRRPGDRQPHLHRGPRVGRAREVDPTPVGLHDLLGEGEAQTDPTRVSRAAGVAPEERSEDPGLVLG
jgi:hypothetical protein